MAKGIKTEWNLKQFYASPSDPQIEKDVRAAEKAYAAFAKKYRGKDDYQKSAQALLKALQDQDALIEKSAQGAKAIYYFEYIHVLNSMDHKAEAMVHKLSDRLTKAGNEVLFFDIALGEIEPKKQKQFLKSPMLKKYRYFLERTFMESKYQLSEKEEKILTLKSTPARSMWVSGVEKLVNKQEVPFKKKMLPIAEALNLINTLGTAERRTLHASVLERLKSASDFAESEMNAVYTDKKINDELRGFKKPYSGTILGYENTEKSIEALVSAVTKDFSTSQEFFKLKKQLLKLKELTYADRAVSIGTIKKQFSFEDSYKILRDIFYGLGKEYGEVLDRFVENGHVDAFPKKGKGGGAFCSSGTNQPTLVLLNHVPSFNSLMTFAHEMGHAVHAEMSKTQPLLYQGHTISVAETASTFFEAAVFSAIFETLNDEEKIIALHDRIQDDISTIHRQIAFFNFELELHQRVRKEGMVPKEEIAKMLNAHMKAYMGPAMSLSPEDGYFFVTVSHFRRPFYVYSYAYGQLISKALYEKCAEDRRNIEKVGLFLKAGGSKSPENIFREAGVDTRTAAVFERGLVNVKKDIAELKRLTKGR